MPTISQAVAKNQAQIAAGRPLVETATPAPSAPVVPGALPPVVTSGLPVRGVYTPQQILATDFADNTKALRSGANLRSAAFPPPPLSSATTAKAAASKITIQQVAAALLLKTNNVTNPSQTLLNILNGVGMNITVDAFGNVTFNSTSAGDGLAHGDAVWAVDSAWPHWYDDFYFGSASAAVGGANTLGELRWDAIQGSGAQLNKLTGFWPHLGQLRIDSGTTSANGGTPNSCIFPPRATFSDSGGLTGGVFCVGLPLLDYAGWKQSWVFGFPPSRGPSAATYFPLTQIQFYCGLAPLASTTTTSTWMPNNTSARPLFFIGLRFDSDPGGNNGTGMSITSVDGGTGVYHGTITGGGSNAYVGYYVTMTGFAGSANNGTFLVTASTAIAITVTNAQSTADTTGTATIPAIKDTTFKFEVVSNPNNSGTGRNNTAGTVFDTGVVPAENIYYRFEIISTTAGVVIMNLIGDDGSFATNTFSSIPVSTVGPSGLVGTHSQAVNNGILQLTQSAAFAYGFSNPAWAPGSKVTVTGATNAYFNKTWVIHGDVLNDHWLSFTGDATNITETTSPSTWTGYPGLAPYFSWGNDTEATPVTKSISLDFWAFVVNPGLAGATPNSTLSRYF